MERARRQPALPSDQPATAAEPARWQLQRRRLERRLPPRKRSRRRELATVGVFSEAQTSYAPSVVDVQPLAASSNAQTAAHEPDAEALQTAASERFGVKSLHPWQLEAMLALVERNKTVVIAPTGGGKSLCYQLPAHVLPGTGLVISPLISLMEDQVRSLEERGISATYLASNLDRDESFRRLDGLRDGRYDIVYVAPERLGFDGFLAAAAAAKINLVAIDEAHCIVQWGHDFRPDYMRIGSALSRLGAPRVVACTATATPDARDEIVRQLALEDAAIILRGFARPNLHLTVHPVASRKEMRDRVDAALLSALSSKREPKGAGIVYSATRKGTEALAEWLVGKGYPAKAYHAGMSGDERTRVANAFASGELAVVVATNAFGMGIDRADVRVVVHAQPPSSLEAYYQEVGRAGRDGNPAEGVLLFSTADVGLRRRLCELGSDGMPPPADQVERAWNLFRELLRYVDAATCRHDYILRYFGDDAESLGGCGHCDVCLSAEADETETDKALDAVRRGLAGVARAKQRAGLSAIASMLAGDTNARTTKFGFDQLSTFGILRDWSHERIMALLRVLLAGGWIDLSTGDFPVPYVTKVGWRVMKGELSPAVRLPVTRRSRGSAPSRDRSRTASRKTTADDALSENESQVYEALRKKRLDLAREHGVPSYVVATDRSLREMAKAMPKDELALEAVYGFGPSRVERYGEPLLSVIRALSD